MKILETDRLILRTWNDSNLVPMSDIHKDGKEFMSLVEKWLRLESYKSIHTESSPAALKFYQAINYVKMPFNDPDGYEGNPAVLSNPRYP